MAMLCPAIAAADGWLSTVQDDIRAAEYAIRCEGGRLEAPNRAQGFRTSFDAEGIRLVPRVEGAAPWSLSLELRAQGRPGHVVPVDAVAPEALGDRVEYRRGHVIEWYVNGSRGLEQGFTLTAPPDAERGELRLEMSMGGDVLAYQSADGAIDLRDARGVRVLRLAELRASDAQGRDVPARFDVAPGTLAILLDARDATWPITIDPLITSPAWTVDGNQADAKMGWAVATAGDVNGDGFSDVVVGAVDYDDGETDEGKVWLYLGSASGLLPTPAWSVEGNAASVELGFSIATAGDVNGDGFSDIAVATPFGGADLSGVVTVYHGSASGLSTTPSWSYSSTTFVGELGYSVASAGDVNRDGYDDLVAGSPGYDSGGQFFEGALYLWLGSPSGLAATPAQIIESNVANANLGQSVGTAGDVNGDGFDDVIVGAPLYERGLSQEGSAYVYLGSAAGLGAAPAWTGRGGAAWGQYGISVSTAGDVDGDGFADVIVGQHDWDGAVGDEGRVLAYLGSPTGPSPTASWIISETNPGAQLGWAVSTAGDVNGDGFADVLVGARFYSDPENLEGQIALYLGSDAGLATTPEWTFASDQDEAVLGQSVATAGDVNGDGYSDIIAGAQHYDDGELDEGRAFVFLGSPGGVAAAAAWSGSGGQADAWSGWSVAGAGDVDGDGYSDVLVGAAQYDDGETDEGAAFLYRGSRDGLLPMPAWTAEGEQPGARFGTSVARAGDVNGDGYSDVIIGAPQHDDDQVDEGRAYLYLGSPLGLSSVAAWTADGDQDGALLGWSVGTAGDVNGDGLSDVIVGAHGDDGAFVDAGRAAAYLGTPAGLMPTPTWTAVGAGAGDAFGYSVGTAGDVNRDGYSDVIVGAPYADGGEIDEGRAQVYLGSALGLASTPAWSAELDQAQAAFGLAVATAGDVDGDGYSDVVVGAYDYGNGQSEEGIICVYRGSLLGLSAAPAWSYESNQAEAELGISVASAGDVNGDGYSDLACGSASYDAGQADEGRASIWLGSASGLAASPAWTSDGGQAGAYFGCAMAGVGDVDGDGYGDVMIGAYLRDDAQADEGGSFLHYGNEGGGLDRIPRQARFDLSAPIDILGAGSDADGFALRVDGRTPWGRERVLFECEVKPLSQDFDGTGLFRTTWADTEAPGPDGSVVPLDARHPPLPSGVPYHWRLRLRSKFPFPWQSHWMSMPTNAMTETDLRSAGNPLSCSAGPPVILTCPGDTGTLDGSLSSGPPGLTYAWSCPDAGVSIASPGSPITDVTITMSGVYTLTLAIDDGADMTSCSTTVSVGQRAAPLEVSASSARVQLRVTKDEAAAVLHVSFEDRGAPGELFGLYAGTIPSIGCITYDHAPLSCAAVATPLGPGAGEILAPFDAGTSHYYLVTASDCAHESTLGFRSDAIERPAFPTECGPLP